MNLKRTISSVALGLLGLGCGFGAGIAYEHRGSGTDQEWAALHNYVFQSLSTTPGFEAEKTKLQLAFDAVQTEARREIRFLPRTAKQRRAYRATVILFVADEAGRTNDASLRKVAEDAFFRLAEGSE